MAVKTENIELGVCDVTFDNLDLGATKGGVEVSFETSTYEVKIDQFGETPAKELVTGTKITVKVPMVETDLDKLLKVMPQARAVTSGGSTVGLRIGTGINIDMLAIGKELRLHPTGRLASETKSDLGLYKAAPSANFSFSYQTGQERVYEVTFTAYPAPEFADELCWFGKKPELIGVFWGRATSSNPNEAAIEAFPGSQLRAQRQGPVKGHAALRLVTVAAKQRQPIAHALVHRHAPAGGQCRPEGGPQRRLPLRFGQEVQALPRQAELISAACRLQGRRSAGLVRSRASSSCRAACRYPAEACHE